MPDHLCGRDVGVLIQVVINVSGQAEIVAPVEVICIGMLPSQTEEPDHSIDGLDEVIRRVIDRPKGDDPLPEALEGSRSVREEGVDQFAHEETAHAAYVLPDVSGGRHQRHGPIGGPIVACPPVVTLPLLSFLDPVAERSLVHPAGHIPGRAAA